MRIRALMVLGPLLISLIEMVPAVLAQPSILSSPRFGKDGEFVVEASSPAGRKRTDVSEDLDHWMFLDWSDALEFTLRYQSTESQSQLPRFFRVVCDTPGIFDDLDLRITKTNSTSVTLSWKPIPGATSSKIYLAAEPCCADVGLPRQKLVGAVAADVTQFQLTHLAPSVHLFLRVVVDSPGGVHASLVHTRTLGGPRAALDGVVREVLGWSLNAIQLVVTAQMKTPEDSGLGLQSGWRVYRADGREIPVTATHRHSVPIGAPAYGAGPVASGDVNRIDVDHRLFLILGEEIGSPEILTVEGPRNIKFTLPFSDRYIETPVVQLNQVGYNPRATERFAYVSGWMGDGGPLDLTRFPTDVEVLSVSTNDLAPWPVVRRLPLASRRALDSDAGVDVREIDLSAVPADERARYRIRIPGVGVSWPTTISERAAFKLFFTISRALFHQRWGGNLATNYTEWARPADHPTVFTAEGATPYEMFPRTQARTGQRALVGGHHDAGDFDQELTHTKVPELLMRAYEVAPEAFVDGQLILPESGNGVPDLLDEALWNIAAWEQLQEADGSVRMGVESYEHPPNQGVLANTDTLPYWTYSVGVHHTARCSGMFAQASRLLAPFDPSRASRLLDRAKKAYHYATQHGAAPAALIWGASELARVKGDDTYRDNFESIWKSQWKDGSFPFAHLQLDNSDFTENINIPTDYWMGYLTGINTSDLIVSQQRQLMDQASRFKIQEIHTEHAHRNSRPEGYSFGFGQGTVVEKYLDPIYGWLQLADLNPAEKQQGFNALSLAADFLLGCNPNGLVYFTGLGTRRIEEPLHLDSLAFIKLGLGPIPGIPAYGPSDGMYCDTCDWTEATRVAFHPAFGDQPRGRRFGDNRLLIVNTEFSVWECMAPHAELFAVLMRGTRGMMPPVSFRPRGADHRSPLP